MQVVAKRNGRRPDYQAPGRRTEAREEVDEAPVDNPSPSDVVWLKARSAAELEFGDAIMDHPVRSADAKRAVAVVLAEKERDRDFADCEVAVWVRNARAVGLSWSEVGRCLGVSQQAVSKRYG
jgi:hypothetical protein